MQSRVRHVSYVLDFLDNGFDSNEISKVLKSETDAIIDSIDFNNLEGWEIQFRAIYTNGKQLLISKNKIGTYTSDKYKEITIPIPIPAIDVVPWGVREDQHIYDENHYDKIMKNFNSLDVDFYSFKNRADYILDCLRRAIRFSFESGITIAGIKLKIPTSKLS